MYKKLRLLRLGLFAFVGLLISPVSAQEIMLDTYETLNVPGDPITVYQAYKDPSRWYYIPSRIRLASNPDGSPSFSFTKLIRNAKIRGRWRNHAWRRGRCARLRCDHGAKRG